MLTCGTSEARYKYGNHMHFITVLTVAHLNMQHIFCTIPDFKQSLQCNKLTVLTQIRWLGTIRQAWVILKTTAAMKLKM